MPFDQIIHTWMFGNSSPSKIIKDISKTGADGLDLSVTYNDDIQIYTTARFRTELEEHNLYIGVITPIYKNPYIDLSHSDEKVRHTALEFTKKCIDLAESFCCPMLISPSFISPTYSYHISRKEDWKQAVQSMILVAQYANAKKVKLMIEPINRYMVGLIHTFTEAKNMIEEIGYSNIGVALDTFHMNMEEPDTIEKTLIRAKDYLYCLHLGENNRQPPGNGALNWPSILKTLEDINYSGFLSHEPVELYFDQNEVSQNETYKSWFVRKLAFSIKYIKQCEY